MKKKKSRSIFRQVFTLQNLSESRPGPNVDEFNTDGYYFQWVLIMILELKNVYCENIFYFQWDKQTDFFPPASMRGQPPMPYEQRRSLEHELPSRASPDSTKLICHAFPRRGWESEAAEIDRAKMEVTGFSGTFMISDFGQGCEYAARTLIWKA